MEWKDVLGELVTFVKTASPEVWRILIKQVYIIAAQNLIGVGVCVTLAVLLFKAAKSTTLAYHEDDGVDYLMVMIFSIATILLAAAIARLINPEFYAIQYLLQSLGGS